MSDYTGHRRPDGSTPSGAPLRPISDAERTRRGQLIMDGLSPHATTFRGVTMRSKLETDFARHLAERWKHR